MEAYLERILVNIGLHMSQACDRLDRLVHKPVRVRQMSV